MKPPATRPRPRASPIPGTDASGTTTAAPERPAPVKGAGLGVLLALLATVVRSGSFVVARALHDTVPPVQAAFWRWTVALVALAPLAARETELGPVGGAGYVAPHDRVGHQEAPDPPHPP
ncbi:EamA family transporter [Streptomyces sp. SR27]|uniref:EamA family transporter n=1 Tax=Streptomyces sp. SR27 TaxID=3076630 RepID=UPI003FA3AD19